jgi:hypothetical protein
VFVVITGCKLKRELEKEERNEEVKGERDRIIWKKKYNRKPGSFICSFT